MTNKRFRTLSLLQFFLIRRHKSYCHSATYKLLIYRKVIKWTKRDRQCTYNVKFKHVRALLLPRKTISIIYFCVCVRACVRVPGRVGLGVCMRVSACSLVYPSCDIMWRHLWPLSLHHIFLHYLVKGAVFGKTLLNIKCVFWFSIQLLFKTLLILRRI